MVKDLLKSGRKAMDALDFTPSKEGFEYDDLENEINQVKEAAGKGAGKVSSRFWSTGLRKKLTRFLGSTGQGPAQRLGR